MKFLILVVAVGVLLWMLFGRSRVTRRNAGAGGPSPHRSGAREGMVACAHCGVHVPESEAVRRDGRSYCSTAHLEAGPSGPTGR